MFSNKGFILLSAKLDTATSKRHLRAIKARIEENVETVSRVYAEKAVQATRDEMQKSKSGRKYPRLPHRSSAPGESLRSQSGAGSASFSAVQVGRSMFAVRSSLWYIRFNMEKRDRPTSKLGVKRVKPAYMRAIYAAIGRA